MAAGRTLVALITLGFSWTFVVGCDDRAVATGTEAGPLDAAIQRPPLDAVSERPVGIRLPPAESRPSCNGSPLLCDRTYDSVAFLATHHSSAVGPTWSAPTQGRSIEDQLSVGGVRAFELEVHANGSTLAICAGACTSGSESLLRVLGKFHTFLMNNPGDVVTILVRSRVRADALSAAFDSAGLSGLAHGQARGAQERTVAIGTTSGTSATKSSEQHATLFFAVREATRALKDAAVRYAAAAIGFGFTRRPCFVTCTRGSGLLMSLLCQ